MTDNSNLGVESPSVQKHVEIAQGVITRMAENSRSCKVWCVILVSAVLVLVARTGKADHSLIAIAPAALFYLLDAYYLMLERRFRNSYNNFVDKVHAGQATTLDLYTVVPGGSTVRVMLWAMFRSFSVLPFYVVVITTVLLAWLLIL